MTIEHIAHQSQQKGSVLTDEQVGEIGNLILVDEDLNGKLGAKPFSEKHKMLMNSQGVWKDDYLSKQTDWGATQIRKRSDHLAKLAFEKVWKI